MLSLAQHLHLVLLTIGYHIAAADSMRCAHRHHVLSALRWSLMSVNALFWSL
jgi:hypothetical protein